MAEERIREIRLETGVDAPPNEVWEAWADPTRLAGWFVDRAEGEPVPGTAYVWFWDDFGMRVPVDVVEAVPGERLVLRTDMGAEASLLEITVERAGGRTRLRLVQSGFDASADDPGVQGVLSGWTLALGLLRLFLERHRGRERRDVLVTREGPFGPALLLPLQRNREGVGRWLVEEGATGLEEGIARVAGGGRIEGTDGPEVRLVLAGGTPLTGRVLAASDTEAVVSWEEIEGALELKSFPAPDGRWTAGLRVSTWSGREGTLERVRPVLEGALDRLVEVLVG